MTDKDHYRCGFLDAVAATEAGASPVELRRFAHTDLRAWQLNTADTEPPTPPIKRDPLGYVPIDDLPEDPLQ